MSEDLSGARIKRVDGPNTHAIVLTLDNECLVLGVGRDANGLGLVEERPRGDEASPLIQKLRHHLEGARILALEDGRQSIRLKITRGEGPRILFIDSRSRAGRLELRALDGTVILSQNKDNSAFTFSPTMAAVDVAVLRAHGAALVAQTFTASLADDYDALSKAIEAHASRLQKRVEVTAKDAARANDAATLREHAGALLANAHLTARGPCEIDIPNPFSEDAAIIRIALGEGRTLTDEAAHLFHRAKKFDTGAVFAKTRIAQTEREIAALATLRERAKSAARSPSLLRELWSEAHRLRIPGARARLAEGVAPQKTHQPRRVPFRRFRNAQNMAILVGKGAADNDTLTLKHTRPHDLWLHVRDVPGAHVVVPLDKGKTCPSETLIDAAHLAAHFSDSKNAPVVDVQYVEKRHVRKPKGSPPGRVESSREKVITVRIDETRLKALLAAEDPD